MDENWTKIAVAVISAIAGGGLGSFILKLWQDWRKGSKDDQEFLNEQYRRQMVDAEAGFRLKLEEERRSVEKQKRRIATLEEAVSELRIQMTETEVEGLRVVSENIDLREQLSRCRRRLAEANGDERTPLPDETPPQPGKLKDEGRDA